MEKIIVCIGSGGFGNEDRDDQFWRNERLIRFASETRGVRKPRITILPTASGDDRDRVGRFLARVSRACYADEVSLFSSVPSAEIRERLVRSDLIYVPGGNTASMLAVWRAHRVDQFLKTAYEHGTIMAGCSAGALCWFEEGTTDSFGCLSVIKNGLGWLKGSYSPHGSNLDRCEFHRHSVYRGELSDGIVQHDLSTLVFRDGELVGCEGMNAFPSYACRKIQDGVAMDPIPSSPLPF